MSPVTSLSIDPVYVVLTNPGTLDSSGCGTFYPCFLLVPNQLALAGLTVHAQFFESLPGSTNFLYPFAASAVVSITVQP